MKIVILCTDFRNFLTSYMDNFVVWTVLKFRDSKPKTARYVLRNDNCENRLKFPKLLKNCRDRFQFRFYVTVLPILLHVAHKFQVIRCCIFENFDFFEILIKYCLGPITYILRCRIIYTDRITLSVAEKKIDLCRKKWRTPLKKQCILRCAQNLIKYRTFECTTETVFIIYVCIRGQL